MYRTACLLGLALVAAGRAAADEAPPLKEALALQDAFQHAIRAAEPSVACVLVSRSDVYERWFGQVVPKDTPGHLGSFHWRDPRLQLSVPERDYPQIEALKKTLAKRARNPGPAAMESELKRMYDLSDPANVPESYGSGVVIDARGLVLTNYHVIRDATKVYVRLPGGKGSYADIHAADPRSDLAVLRLLDPPLPLRALRRGDGGKARKGQLVLTLANPFAAGFKDGEPSASWGIISNIRRRVPGESRSELDRAKWTIHQYGTLLQLDARLNLGCSGGALIDLEGRLIGLTTALAAIAGGETAGGYALPLDDTLARVVEVLARGEEVEYGFLGVSVDQLQPETGGVRVSLPIPGSPAAQAGIHTGDIIEAINDHPLRETDDLFLAVGTQLAGAEVRLDVNTPNRGKRQVTTRLAKYYVPGPFIAANRPKPVRGLRVDYTSILPQRDSGRRFVPPGVYVREVLEGSPAETAQLLDAVITRVNDQPVHAPAEFYRIAGQVTGPLELTVAEGGRGGNARKVKLN